ncbi:MAG: SpoIID/LytB domain-containing protein [Oscillospiraceae bacterium]|nr:SpoIID/LytB domain-containing protein [Oscillospiraceae bacterium]
MPPESLTHSPPTPTPRPADPTPEPPAPAAYTINVTMNGVQRTMELQECLAMITQNEMGSGQPLEAYKAQAVAAHSWILSQGGGYPSVAGITPTAAVREAVAQVWDKIVTYNGSVAFTPYFASSNNGTVASVDVWGGVRPYLVAVESKYDSQVATNWETTAVYHQDNVAQRVLERTGIDLWEYSDDPADWFEVLSYNTTGYVMKIRVGDQQFTGKYLRENILNKLQEETRGYAFTIRSAAYDIEYRDDCWRFTARGYGHCCGMSQFGAIGYASIEGWTYDRILAHYYQGTGLSTIR